jgi:hypothetical protein
MRRFRALLLGVLLGMSAHLTSTRASAEQPPYEPWSDYDGMGPHNRYELGDFGFRGGAEYRANWLYVRPLNLNGTRNRNASWIEHRLRLDGAIDYEDKVRIVTSIDGLEGTLWGDNGIYGGSPSPNSGVNASASIPNNATIGVAYKGHGDELDPQNYGYVLVPGKPLHIRRAYGEIVTPVGMFRIGRQPTIEGTSILAADGDGRPNRFGYSNEGDSSDRILFATKPLEGLKPKNQRDTSRNRGLFLIAFYDRVTTNQVHLFGDDTQGGGVGVRYLKQDPVHQQSVQLLGVYSKRWEAKYDTDINIMTARAIGRFGKLSAGVEGAGILGATREVSQALSLINSDPIVRQKVQQFGARAVVRWDEPTWTAYFESDFASGDHNPNPGTPLTQLYFAEDNNVGLLMFERTLHFASQRSAAAGVELLRRIGAHTFPAERVDSEGSFTNAIAIFPQFGFHPEKELLFRGGVLMAWAPAGVVDPTRSLYLRDGNSIEDDLVNFNGGKPGTFYGTEFDGRFSWRYLDHFIFDLEGALLIPGDAFYNKNRQAARSGMVQGRTTFVF